MYLPFEWDTSVCLMHNKIKCTHTRTVRMSGKEESTEGKPSKPTPTCILYTRREREREKETRVPDHFARKQSAASTAQSVVSEANKTKSG